MEGENKESRVKRVLGYFLKGVLLTVPIGVTLYIIIALLNFIDTKIPTGVDIPGLGILILIFSLVLIGFLGNSIISSPLVSYLNRLLDKAPLIKTIYSAIKDLVSAFVGSEKKFNQPVSVKIGKNSNLEKLGFITREDLSQLGIQGNKVAVYLPHSYAWSGNLFVVDKENVTALDVPASDMMKFIISGGVSNLDSKE